MLKVSNEASSWKENFIFEKITYYLFRNEELYNQIFIDGTNYNETPFCACFSLYDALINVVLFQHIALQVQDKSRYAAKEDRKEAALKSDVLQKAQNM